MQSTPLGNGLYHFQGPPVCPTGPVDAVIWHSVIKNESGNFISHGTKTKVTAKDLETHPGFRKSPLSERLGVPLGSVPVTGYLPQGPFDEEALSQTILHNAHLKSSNIFANYLHVSIDTSNPHTFSYRQFEPLEGDVIFMRLDHGPLNVLQMHALEQFCCFTKGFLRYHDNAASKPDLSAYAREILDEYTPKKFADFFEEHRQSCMERGLKDWEAIECPVLGLCGRCFKDDGDEKLEVCSKCKRRKYCGTTCQKEDWARHKKLCKKGKQ